MNDRQIKGTSRNCGVWLGIGLMFVGLSWVGPPIMGQLVMTPQHIAKVREVTAVAVHPSGENVAYLLAVPRVLFQDEDGPAYTQLWVASRSGPGQGPTEAKPYVTGKESISNIAWAPDGRAISFLAKRTADKKKALYIIPVDGGEARKIVGFAEEITAYAWAPDGRQVAFLANAPGNKAQEELKAKGFSQQIYEEEVRSTKVWVTTVPGLAQFGAFPGEGDSPTPAPAGSEPAKGDGATGPKLLTLEGHASDLSWSPRGDALALALAPTALVDDSYMQKRVRLVDPKTGAILAKFDNPGKLGAIAVSPDGASVAFISGADIHDPHEGRLMVGDVKTGAFRDVLPNYLGHVSAFVWKDAQTLLYLGDEGALTIVGQVGRDGSGKATVIPAGNTIWTALDLAAKGPTLALIGQAPQHPSEVFACNLEDKAIARLTQSNPWLADITLAKQEVVTYQAKDGTPLEGILIHPLKREPNARVPLVLNVHGGPEAHVRNGWLNRYADPGQMAAAKGFAVFAPNYRGSTGRGVAFSKLGQGDPAGKEFDDLVDAVDHFVNTGLADPKKVGITGGSYGGYASAWGATYYSHRFAASVMFVGISDVISKTGTTDIANEEFYVHALKRPWERWQLMLERSPIYHATKGKTPLLILHGKDDPRVFPGQSMELYRFLKVLNQAPVRLIFYPGEGHGNRRAASRYDYSLRMLQWFEHYLQGPGGSPPAYELNYPR